MEAAIRFGLSGGRPAIVPILRRYAASSGTLFFGAISQFISFVLLARILGIEQFGKLMAITAVTALAMVLCGLGAGDAMIRRTARDSAQFSVMLGHGLLLIGATGIPLAVITTFVLSFFVHTDGGVIADTITVGLLSFANILLFAFVNFVERAFLGGMQFHKANVVNGGFSLIRLLAAIGAAFVFQVQTLYGWALTISCAYAIASGIGWAMLRSLGRPVWGIDRKELRLGIHFTTPFVVDALRQNVDRIMLGIFAPISVLGSYSAAIRMVTTSQIVINSLNRIMYPKLAQSAEHGLRSVLRLATSYLFGLLAVAAATSAMVFFIAPMMPYVLGRSYQPVVFDLQVLSWLVIPVAIRTVPYDIFGAIDRHHVRATIFNTVALIGTAVTAILIYCWGITGAFIGAYGVQIALALAQWIAIARAARRDVPSSAVGLGISAQAPNSQT